MAEFRMGRWSEEDVYKVAGACSAWGVKTHGFACGWRVCSEEPVVHYQWDYAIQGGLMAQRRGNWRVKQKRRCSCFIREIGL